MAEYMKSWVLMAVALVTLSGCAGGQQIDETGTAGISTATQAMQDEFDAVQDEFGGEWEVQDLGAPLSCPDQEGSASRATRYGVPDDASLAVLEAARERWAVEGYTIEERTDPNGLQRLFATKDDGSFRQIALGSNVIMLQGSTACLPEER